MTSKPIEKNPAEEERDWILVGVDLSRSGRRALDEAIAMARRNGAEVLVLHVIEVEGLGEIASAGGIEEGVLRERLEQERRRQVESVIPWPADGEGPPIKLLICWGHPYEEILRRAREFAVDLIVMGIAGRSADLQRALFGSTAEKVLRGAPCPVLCVPPGVGGA